MSEIKVNPNKPHLVAHPDTGEVVTMREGKDGKNYGKVRVDQITTVIHNNMERDVKRSAFITLPEDVLARRMAQGTLEAGMEYKVAGRSGKLKVIESVTPFFEAQTPKTKGADGETITSGGLPVYRETVFTLDLEELDVLLPSDSVAVESNATPATKQGETVE